MAREAFLPLFFGDFLGATSEWAGEEASLYLTCLGYQWSQGSLPADLVKLCRLVRWERKNFDRCWPQVSEKFVNVDGRLLNTRLEEHRAKSQKVAEKNSASGKAGAEARWGKHGERHSGANGASDGERHQSGNTTTNGNPSHPIPSHVSPPSGEGASGDAAPPPADGIHPPSSDAKPARPKRRGPLGHFVPTDWEVPDADADWAKAEFPLLDLYAATQKFREHEFAQPKSDWRLTWRRWIRTEAEMQARRAGNGRR